jgi:hypothetical protein
MSMTPRRTAVRAIACAMAVASFGAASSAQAADPPRLCPSDPPVALDGSFSFSNQVGSIGCVTIHVARGVSTLEKVTVVPSWGYTVKSNGGTTSRSRVEVQFLNSATRAKAELRSEAGRLVIK